LSEAGQHADRATASGAKESANRYRWGAGTVASGITEIAPVNMETSAGTAVWTISRRGNVLVAFADFILLD
jgi:hypothetical protein